MQGRFQYVGKGRVSQVYRISGNIGGHKIWRFGFKPGIRKYRRDLNLALGPALPPRSSYANYFTEFNLAVKASTAKPPNLILRQYFHLYGNTAP